MANLTRKPRWVRFEPDFGGNLELPEAERFYFEVATSLTKEELAAWSEKLSEKVEAINDDHSKLPAALAEALEDVVRMGKEPLSVDGREVKTLEDYFGLFMRQADIGKPETLELTAAVTYLNSYRGSRALFSGRLSGGATSTRPPSTGLGGSQTAGPRSGSNTNSSASSG